MIFIVVKFPVRPEHADSWLALVDDFTRAFTKFTRSSGVSGVCTWTVVGNWLPTNAPRGSGSPNARSLPSTTSAGARWSGGDGFVIGLAAR